MIWLFVMGVCNVGNAQSTAHAVDTVKNADNSSTLQFSVRYKSDSYYMGRADSAKAPYIIPSVSYYHKSGLFLSGYVSYLTASNQNRVDVYTVAGGYDYFGEKVLAGISVSQYFFNDSSYAVQSEMRTYLSAYAGYYFKGFMLVADASLAMSSSMDYFLGGEISRSFYMIRNKLRITPSFNMNWGTQNYYKEYYSERSITTGSKKSSSNISGNGQGGQGLGSGPGSGISTGGGGTTTTTTIKEVTTLESEKFQLLDYEWALQASYKLKQFRFIASATVLLPVNPSTVVTDQGTYEEVLKTGWLWSAGIRYIIR